MWINGDVRRSHLMRLELDGRKLQSHAGNLRALSLAKLLVRERFEPREEVMVFQVPWGRHTAVPAPRAPPRLLALAHGEHAAQARRV